MEVRKRGGQPGYVPPERLDRISQAVLDAGLRWIEEQKQSFTIKLDGGRD